MYDNRRSTMITLKIDKNDLKDAKTEVSNLAGAFFAGTSPLIRPFMDMLESIVPADQQGRGTSYLISALRYHIRSIRADESGIRVESEIGAVDIPRTMLEKRIEERYPSFGHDSLNLPGLLFLQSGPAVHAASVSKLRKMHRIVIPEGRRTQRYIFHVIVRYLEADQDTIKMELDTQRLPLGRPEGSTNADRRPQHVPEI